MYSAVSRARRKGLEMTRSTPLRASPMAAACVRLTSSSGGSSRPIRRPEALNPVRPWRTRISTLTVDHTREGCSHERRIEVTGAPEQAPAAGVGEPEPPPGPHQDHQSDQLHDHADGAPVERRQRLVTGTGTAERPPEDRRVGPRSVEDEVEEHPDGQGQPAPAPGP